MRVGAPETVLAVLCALIAAGGAYAYCIGDHGYSSSAWDGGDSASYSIDANGSHEYAAVLFDAGGIPPVREVYLYSDAGYGFDFWKGGYEETHFADQTRMVLENRGVGDVSIVGADGLRDALAEDLAGGSASGKGLVVSSGALPSTVYSGDPSDTVLRWISSGGSLYWGYGVVGQFVGEEGNGIRQVNGQALFTGEAEYAGADGDPVRDLDATRELFSFGNAHTRYAFDASATSAPAFPAGYTDGTHASVTFFGLGEGQVCVCAGDRSVQQLRDIATAVASGLTCYAEIIGYETGTVDGHASGSIPKGGHAGNLRLFVIVGGYFPVYEKCHEVRSRNLRKWRSAKVSRRLPADSSNSIPVR